MSIGETGLKINFITLFPKRIESYFQYGLPKKAVENKIFEIQILDLRKFSTDKFGRVDDTVYGGGAGMLLKVEPIHRALEFLGEEKGAVCLMTPSGEPFSQAHARNFSESKKNITLISGYYEGIDYRVNQFLIDKELSIGNYVISSGDLASLCVSDAIVRLLPGFMGGGQASLSEESHNEINLLEYPQYTKPSDYNGWIVPEVLLSGNHAEISKWKERNRIQPRL